MTKILVVDSSLSGVAMALVDQAKGPEPIAVELHVENMGAVAAIGGLAKRVLQEAGVRVSDLAGVAVSAGPGSFTGIKVGLAFVNGLAAAFASPLPILGLSAAEAAAERYWIEQGSQGTLALFIPATRTHGFLAVHGGQALAPACLIDVEGNAKALIEALPDDAKLAVFSRWPLCDSLTKGLGRSLLELAPWQVCREAIYGMAKRAVDQWPNGFLSTPPAPRYLRLSTAEERLQGLSKEV